MITWTLIWYHLKIGLKSISIDVCKQYYSQIKDLDHNNLPDFPINLFSLSKGMWGNYLTIERHHLLRMLTLQEIVYGRSGPL